MLARMFKLTLKVALSMRANNLVAPRGDSSRGAGLRKSKVGTFRSPTNSK